MLHSQSLNKFDDGGVDQRVAAFFVNFLESVHYGRVIAATKVATDPFKAVFAQMSYQENCGVPGKDRGLSPRRPPSVRRPSGQSSGQPF